MSYPATVFNVMIASPGDVAEERNVALEIILKWNYKNSHERGIVLLPIGWENSSAALMEKTEDGFKTAQDVINIQVLSKADLMIAIFWTRIGTKTNNAVSGTVEEIEKHVQSGKPAMLYFSDKPHNPSKIDKKQYGQVEKIRRKYQKQSYYFPFVSVEEFKEKFSHQLDLTVNQYPLFKNESGQGNNAFVKETLSEINKTSQYPHLSKEATMLLLEAASGSDGNFTAYGVLAGFFVQANNINFVQNNKNAKEEVKWRAVIKELIEGNLNRTCW